MTALPWIFSASQVETFMSCRRKWAWKYIAGIKPEQARSAQVGDACHGQLETHLQGGQIDFTKVVHGVRIGDVIAPGLPLLPKPLTPGMTIEETFNFKSARGLNWTGRKDLQCADGAVFPAVEGQPDVPAGMPVCSDHKSTKSIELYAKSPRDLEWDVQANLYGYERCHATGAPAVDLVWTYFQTSGAKKAKRVHLRVTRDHVTDAFNRIEAIGLEMARVHSEAACELDKAAFVQSLPPNPRHCKDFGGCPYQAQCSLSLTEQERFSASMSEGDFFSTLANVAAADDAKAGAVAPVPAAPPPSNVFEDAKVDESRAMVHTTPQPANPPAPDLFPLPAINPPESALTTPTLSPPVYVPSGDTSLLSVGTEPAAPPAEPVKRPRGRPRKDGAPAGSVRGTTAEDDAKPAPVEGKNVTGQVFATPADGVPLERVLPTDGDIRVNPRPISFHLFVDCLPDGASPMYADELIARANAIVVEQTKATDKPVAHYKFLQYGAAAGALDIALGQVLDEAKPALVFCASTSDALPTLTRRAGSIVRSVR